MFETCRSSAAIRLRLFTIDAEILGSALRSRILARSHSRQRAFTFFRRVADPLCPRHRALRPPERRPVDADGGHGLARRENGAVPDVHVYSQRFGRNPGLDVDRHGEPGRDPERSLDHARLHDRSFRHGRQAERAHALEPVRAVADHGSRDAEGPDVSVLRRAAREAGRLSSPCAAKERLEGAVEAAQGGALGRNAELPEVIILTPDDGQGLQPVGRRDCLSGLAMAVDAFFKRGVSQDGLLPQECVQPAVSRRIDGCRAGHCPDAPGFGRSPCLV
ncbi:MAG: hypothetical protein OXH76_02565 [Boseongicola sp.]|nr:hypothetical protein [Boseongicola sp.]